MTSVHRIPIVYHENYNIYFYGIENILHYFDSKKYGRIFAKLKSLFGIDEHHIFSPATEVSEEFLRLVHTKSYLDSLHSSSTIASVVEIGFLAIFPNFLLQSRLLRPMRYAVEGTLLATQLALEYGWSINLSGGYHHAKSNSGEGFCVFADIPIAIKQFLPKDSNATDYYDKKVLIIDLDAHQGNGYEALFTKYHDDSPEITSRTIINDDRIQIMDVYNMNIYPQDTFAKQFITYDFPIPKYTKDTEYLTLLEESLPAVISNSSPSLVFYNAGTDIYEHDPLGKLSVSEEGIVKRDEMVFSYCRQRNIPIVMVLSGGYTYQSAEIISKSIQNLAEKNIISLAFE